MSEEQDRARLMAAVRDVPDFPKPGIVFKDITPMLSSRETFALCLERLEAPWRGQGVEAVVGIESRGFIFGAALADRLGVGFVPVRKPGKLPWHCARVEYDLEYGKDTLEIHTDALAEGQRVLLVDDVLATGGTAAATIQLIEAQGAALVGAAFLIELTFLGGRKKLGATRTESVIQY